MKISTRYSLGETVWCLRSEPTRDRETCATCAGSGRIQLIDAAGAPIQLETGFRFRRTCPACEGKGYVWQDGHHHEATITRLTLGQVRTVTTAGQTTTVATYGTEISYMAEETGVGSGQIYREPELHPSRQTAIDAFFTAHPTGVLKSVDEDLGAVARAEASS